MRIVTYDCCILGDTPFSPADRHDRAPGWSALQQERRSAMREKRTKIWIDRFQTYLSFRLAVYFFLYQLAVWFLVVIERSFHLAFDKVLGEGATSFFFTFMTVSVVSLGFLLIYDAIRLSHR